MGVTLSAWLASLQALLPPGRALTREAGANLTRVLEAIAAAFLVAQQRLEDLLQQWDPRNATSMLPDWEQLLGLPDNCAPTETLTETERQMLAYQRLIELGGQSRAYFIDMAANLGVPGCTITEFRPLTCSDDVDDALYSQADAFCWRLNVPELINDPRVMNCEDDCTDPLQFYTPNLIECPIRERKPAHTQVLFAYLT